MTIKHQRQGHPVDLDGELKRVILSSHEIDGQECVSQTFGDVSNADSVIVRVQSACCTSGGLGSCDCDCQIQLDESMRLMDKYGAGVIIFFPDHEGKGHGPITSVALIAIEAELGSEEAAMESLGLGGDLRDFSISGKVLEDLGVGRDTTIKLLSENESKAQPFIDAGYEVELTELVCYAPMEIAEYLRKKGYDIKDSKPSVNIPAPHKTNFDRE